MRRMTAAALAVALGTAAAGVAQASVVVLDLTQNGCSGSCFARGVTSLGTVTVADDKGSLDFTVDLNDALFNANGNGQHNALVFDLDHSGLDIGALSAGFAQSTRGAISDAPFGAWTYAIDYVGSARQGKTPSTLSFTVSDAANDLSVHDILAGDIYNGAQLFAAADVYANGKTGNVGAVMAPAEPIGTVPEPATWAMLVLGIGMIGAALRRRARNAAPVDSAA